MGALYVLLIAVGALLTFAVNVVVSGLDLLGVGVALMTAGVIASLASVMRGIVHDLRAGTELPDDNLYLWDRTLAA